jgi:hypothetical protein
LNQPENSVLTNAVLAYNSAFNKTVEWHTWCQFFLAKTPTQEEFDEVFTKMLAKELEKLGTQELKPQEVNSDN